MSVSVFDFADHHFLSSRIFWMSESISTSV
nr:MAG TPA: hypothetical protein [Caudoviricetes sp.]